MFQQVSTEPRRMRYICVKVEWQKSLFQKEIGELKMSGYKNDLTSKSSRLPCRSPAAMLHSLLHLCNHKQFLTGVHKNPYLEVVPTHCDHLRQILLHEDVFLMCGKQYQMKEMVILYSDRILVVHQPWRRYTKNWRSKVEIKLPTWSVDIWVVESRALPIGWVWPPHLQHSTAQLTRDRRRKGHKTPYISLQRQIGLQSRRWIVKWKQN